MQTFDNYNVKKQEGAVYPRRLHNVPLNWINSRSPTTPACGSRPTIKKVLAEEVP